MEIATGKITGVTAEGLTVFVPYTNTERYVRRAYDQVQVGLPDGRTISPEQRRKAYALLREIADWSGDYLESVKDACRAGARMMFLCSPHNPVGRVWSREELEALLAVLAALYYKFFS